MLRLNFKSVKNKQVIDITKIINDLLMKNRYHDGICFLFCTHTTCSLTTAELDPGTDLDLLDAFANMVPKLKYRHAHDPSHVGDHIMTSIVGNSLTIPVTSASMTLGQWQKVVLVEQAGPRDRHLNLSFLELK